jgi:hypothetical protein
VERKGEEAMRKVGLIAGIVAAAIVTALIPMSAAAATDVSVSMTFTEPLIADAAHLCPDLHDTNCGRGVVHPYGLADETVAFFAGCGGECAIRTINLPQGSIVTEETATDFSCPGACDSHSYPHVAPPFSATLTGVIVDGTGIFAGATGTLVGTVVADGWHGQIQLAGTITLAS